MGSFTQSTYHVVFGTKYRRPTITDRVRESLYEYIGGIVRGESGILVAIGGMPDHLHLLMTLHPTMCVVEMARRIKANSSKWMHENLKGMQDFAWQAG